MMQEGTTPLAGGTDLLPRYEHGVALPKYLLDLKHVQELKGIREVGGGLEIGALTSIHEILVNPIIALRYSALAQSARDFAAVQIRHRATVGGNLCNASPAGDTLPPLYAFGASVTIAGAEGERQLPVESLIVAPGKTALAAGELLKSIYLPPVSAESRFFKLGLRDAMAISVVNAAVVGAVEDSLLTDLTIAAGAVAPTVVRLERFAKAVVETKGDITSNLPLIDDEIAPIDDLRATAGYRRQVLKNLLEQTLCEMTGENHE